MWLLSEIHDGKGAEATGCSFGSVLAHVMLVASVNGGFECMIVLILRVKMHLRFGSKAAHTEAVMEDTVGRDSDKRRKTETFSRV